MATTAANGTTISPRTAARGDIGIVLLSIALSVFGAAVLPATMRIRWHIGTYEHWGPERIAAEPVLIAFPVVVVVGYIVSRAIARHLRSAARNTRMLYEVLVLIGLSTVVLMQALLIGLNLVVG